MLMQYNFSLLSLQQLSRQVDDVSLKAHSAYTFRQGAHHSLPDCLRLHVHRSVDIRAISLLQDPV